MPRGRDDDPRGQLQARGPRADAGEYHVGLLQIPALGDEHTAETQPLGIDAVLDALSGGPPPVSRANFVPSPLTAPAMMNALKSSQTGASSASGGATLTVVVAILLLSRPNAVYCTEL